MIKKLDLMGGTVDLQCFGCSEVSTVQIADLRLGISFAGMPDPNVIVLPLCPKCSGQGVLNRTFDAAPARWGGTPQDLHRRAVNSLAIRLRQTGKSHPDCAVIHQAETTEPHDVAASSLVTVPELKKGA